MLMKTKKAIICPKVISDQPKTGQKILQSHCAIAPTMNKQTASTSTKKTIPLTTFIFSFLHYWFRLFLFPVFDKLVNIISCILRQGRFSFDVSITIPISENSIQHIFIIYVVINSRFNCSRTILNGIYKVRKNFFHVITYNCCCVSMYTIH